ncbi:MAG TPA: peptidoglycan bridge formation glycyltransferase FemA/FemB family protein [Vitreimonas sp.]|nr:peptidoglycan bridge formation glycyltransferase FemA/FemB family protein [Vitreimonas sp.]
MLLREVHEEEKALYNAAVDHPLQSWEWGEFRKKTGLKIERVGLFDNNKLQKGLQVTFHPLPLIGQNVGYYPRGFMPDEEQLAVLKQLGKKNNALFVKMEPNIAEKVGNPSAQYQIGKFLLANGAEPGRPLFTKYSFQLDLTKSEDELLANLHSKTRYNVNLAQKKGVQIYENTSAEGMEQYIDVLKETTNRQGFYAHGPEYFRKMWEVVGSSGMMRIFHGVYEDQIIVSWVMFVFNGVLYYPYGASRSAHRDVMASNLMMWEMIKFGQSQGCHLFDMWGSLGPEPDPKDPWFGFHRFKKGYGGDLVEFLGTYDLVLNPPIYKAFRVAENLRWKVLRLKTRLGL